MTNLNKRHINLLNNRQIHLLIDIIDSQLHNPDVEENPLRVQDLCFIRCEFKKKITGHYPFEKDYRALSFATKGE